MHEVLASAFLWMYCFDNDGTVGILDLLTLLANWG